MKLPSQWKLGSLDDAISSVRGGFSVKCGDRQAAPGEKAVLKTGAVLNGRFDPSQSKYVEPSEHTFLRTPVAGGTIVFCRKNSEDAIGAVALVEEDAPNTFLSDLLWELRPKNDVSREWLVNILKSDRVRKLIQVNSTGTQNTMKNISQDRLLNISLAFPPYVEQRKIAEILRTWDEAIEKLEALHKAGERLNSLRADALIFGNRGRRRAIRLGEVTREVTRRNADGHLGRDSVMGVTNSRGIVPMRDQTIGSDLTRYKMLPPRAFAYNPMRINVGSIAMLTLPYDVLVSPDYVAFECVPGKLDPDYLDHLRQSHYWDHHVNAGGSGSVRMRTYYDDLAALKIELPPFDEQLAISKALGASRRELELIKLEISLLTKQKRGLMQKLLTGEWRVNP